MATQKIASLLEEVNYFNESIDQMGRFQAYAESRLAEMGRFAAVRSSQK